VESYLQSLADFARVGAMSNVLAILFFAICLTTGLALVFEALCLVTWALKLWSAPRPSGRDLSSQ